MSFSNAKYKQMGKTQTVSRLLPNWLHLSRLPKGQGEKYGWRRGETFFSTHGIMEIFASAQRQGTQIRFIYVCFELLFSILTFLFFFRSFCIVFSPPISVPDENQKHIFILNPRIVSKRHYDLTWSMCPQWSMMFLCRLPPTSPVWSCRVHKGSSRLRSRHFTCKKAVLRIRDVYPGSRIRIFHPRSGSA
jgi:hypothetical protein